MVPRDYDREESTDLAGYTTKELTRELNSRGFAVCEDLEPLIERIYFLRRCNADYQKELDRLIETAIGRY